MLIALGTDSSDGYNNEKYDFAVINIDEEMAKKMMLLAKMFDDAKKIEPNLEKMVFDPDEMLACEAYTNIWDFAEESPEAIKGVLVGELPYIIIPDDADLPFCPKDANDPESIELQVNYAGFSWAIYPRDSEVIIWTTVIPRDLLTQVI